MILFVVIVGVSRWLAALDWLGWEWEWGVLGDVVGVGGRVIGRVRNTSLEDPGRAGGGDCLVGPFLWGRGSETGIGVGLFQGLVVGAGSG